RERQERKGEGWSEWEKRLRDKLIAVQLEQLQTLADANDWENTYALAIRLADSYRDKDLRLKFAHQLARVIAAPLKTASLKAEDYEKARRRTRMLEELFPESTAALPVSEDLQQKAAAFFAKAKDERDPTEAIKLLGQAETIWPGLPGLHDYRLK